MAAAAAGVAAVASGAAPTTYEWSYEALIGISSDYTRDLVVAALRAQAHGPLKREWVLTPTDAVREKDAARRAAGLRPAPGALLFPEADAPAPVAVAAGPVYNAATAAAALYAAHMADAAAQGLIAAAPVSALAPARAAVAAPVAPVACGPRTVVHAHVVLDWREFEDIDWTEIVGGTPAVADAPRPGKALRASASRAERAAAAAAAAERDPHVTHRWVTYTVSAAFPVRKGLIRKAQLSYQVTKWTSKYPQSVLRTAVPESIPFEIYDPEYIDEALIDLPEVKNLGDGGGAGAGGELWVLKASMVNQAKAVHVFDSVAKFTALVTDQPDIRQWVVQRYIDRPLLIDRKKFHLRAYVLAVGSLRVYLYDSVLALFAADPYERNNIDNLGGHITNTCFQQDRADFDESKSVRSLRELHGLSGLDVNDALAQMGAILHDVFAAVHHEPTVYMPLHNTFELYGVDFLLDADRRVYLLELNAGPDFAQTGVRLQKLCAGALSDTVTLAVDAFVADVQTELTAPKPKPTATAAADAKAVASDHKSGAANTGPKPPPPMVFDGAPKAGAAAGGDVASGKFVLVYDDRALAKGVKANMTFA